LIAGDHVEKGRLARTVGSDDGDAVARIDLKARIHEEITRPESLRELRDGQHPPTV
jgi:hypothetical protein